MGHSHQPSSGGSPESLQAGHELTDVKVGPLLQFGVMLTVIVTVTMWGVLWMHRWLETYFADRAADVHPMQSSGATTSGPRLQVDEAREYRLFADGQHKLVEGDTAYAWIDQPTDVVRVPIARAMELVLQEGLPHRAAGK